MAIKWRKAASAPASVQKSHIWTRDISGGAITLYDGRLRSVVEVRPTSSFGTLSEERKEEDFGRFHSLLNTLDFEVQLLYRLAPADPREFRARSDVSIRADPFSPTGELAAEYQQYTEALMEEEGILEPRYYVVIPAETFNPLSGDAVGTLRNLASRGEPSRISTERADDEREALEERTEHVMRSAYGCELNPRRLTDSELAFLEQFCWCGDLARAQRVEGVLRNGLDSLLVANPKLLDRTKRPARFGRREAGAEASSDVHGLLTDGARTVADYLAPPSVDLFEDFLRIGSEYIRVFEVAEYPREVLPGWLARVFISDKPLEVSIFLKPIDTVRESARLSQAISELEVSIQDDRRRGKVVSKTQQQAYDDNEAVQAAIDTGAEKMFTLSVFVALRAPSERELNRRTQTLYNQFAQMRARVLPLVKRQHTAFHCLLPECTDAVRTSHRRPALATTVATLMPFSSSTLSMADSLPTAFNLHNRSLVGINAFDDDVSNYSMVILASMGSGKSFAAKTLLLRHLFAGAGGIVIDPSHEYLPLAQELGGQVVDLSGNSGHHINRLDLPPVAFDEDGRVVRGAKAFGNHVQEVRGWLEIMLARKSGFSDYEEALVERALFDAYASHGILPDQSTHDRTPPLLSDLQATTTDIAEREDDPVARQLAARLERFITGSYAGMFNHHTNVDLGRDLVVFDIAGITDDMQKALATQMITSFVANQVMREHRPRMLVIDEAWMLAQYASGARFLLSTAKTSRKRYLSLVVCTQELNDFLGNKEAASVLQNASMKLLLRFNSADELRKVSHTLGIPQETALELHRFSRGDGLFFLNLNSDSSSEDRYMPLRMFATPREYGLITTKASEWDPQEVLV